MIKLTAEGLDASSIVDQATLDIFDFSDSTLTLEEAADAYTLTEAQLLEWGLTSDEITQLLAIDWNDLPDDWVWADFDFEDIDSSELPVDFDWSNLDEEQIAEIDFDEYYTRKWQS